MRFCITVFFILFATILFAQEKHFIYIQSDNKQLFYLSVNGKMYSSTASGYAIVPKLENGVYNLKIGFADSATPEQIFECVIDKKDKGYNLKNFGAKGWGLFDLQSLGITMAGSITGNELAKEANQNAKKDEPETPISFERKKDTTAMSLVSKPALDTIQNNPIASQPKVEIETPNLLNENPETGTESGINKVYEKSDSSGLYLSYADKSSNKPDTIRVVIPSSFASSKTGDTSVHSAQPARNLSNISVQSQSCNPATDEDFRKLRKKMASVDSDEKMINSAMKFFKEKCFTTTQIRLLSTLFLSDDGRYKFFDATYPFVSDAGNYSLLQKEFIDPYYLNRFKALLRP